MQQPREDRLNFIVLLRAIAVICVILHHYFAPFDNKGILLGFKSLIENGNTGVIIFFLISGFVIAMSLEKHKPVDFLIKRFFRLYPVLIFATLLSVVLGISNVDFPAIGRHLTLFLDCLPYPYATSQDMIPLSVVWTLEIEWKFYILCAVFVLLGKKLTLKQITYFGLITLFISWYFMNYLTKHGDSNFHPGTVIRSFVIARQLVEANLGVWKYSIIYGTFKFMIYSTFMFIGTLYYFHYKGFISTPTLFIMKILLLFCSMMPYFEHKYCFEKEYIIPLCAFGALYFHAPNLKINKVTKFIADVSYPVYLLHIPVIVFLNKTLTGVIGADAIYIYIPILSLVISFGISYLVHIFLEKPIIKFSKKYTFKKICKTQ